MADKASIQSILQISVPLRSKLLLFFTLLFTIVFALAYLWFFQFATRFTEETLRTELAAIAETAANGVDGDMHTALYASNVPAGRPVNDERYVTISEWLALNKESHGTVIDADGQENFRVLLYTYVPTEETGVVDFVSSSSALNDPPGGAEFRESYEPQSAAMLNGLRETTVNLDVPIEDQWGRWVSAFAPIKSRTGEIVGAVGVDMRETTVAALQQRIRNAALMAFLITYAALFGSVWLLAHQITRPIVDLTRSANQVATGDYDLSFVDEGASRFPDETNTLAQVFEQMVSKVADREQTLQAQVQQLRVEIDESKRSQQVQEIVETDFFQDLNAKAKAMRSRRSQE